MKDSIITQAQLDNMQTVFLAMEGKAEESRAEGERAEHRWLDIGIPALSAYADEGRGEAERFLGRPDLAAEYFGRCIEIWDSLGETSFNSTMTALLALALCDAERFDDAERFVQRSRELSAEDDFASQAVMRMARARILSHRGNHEDHSRRSTKRSRSTSRRTIWHSSRRVMRSAQSCCWPTAGSTKRVRSSSRQLSCTSVKG